MLSRSLEVGDRVSLGGRHKATVKYVGRIEGQEGEWAGLEWDDPSRGKHGGGHEGRRYFDCAPGAGSFVRLPKLLATADAGRGVGEAVAERYTPGAAQGEEGGAGEMYVPTASQRRVQVELVGAAAAAAALAVDGNLRQASLVDMRVSRVGLTEQERSFLGNVSSIDLSDNLVSSWAFVLELAAALPALRTLNLSGNRLRLPPAGAPRAQHAPNLRTLVLNGCGVSWQQAAAACASLPALTELRLCGNSLASLRAGAQQAGALPAALARLETLDLEDNELAEWDDVVAGLARLPSLRALLLSGNRLRGVACPEGGFASLTCLLLGRNALSSWRDVDALDRFPALLEARLSDNPLPGGGGPGATRYEAIARVGRLAALNGSAVGRAERWDAELNYLRQVTDQLAATSEAERGGGGGGEKDGRRAAVLQAHPRFAALTARYGSLAPAAAAASGGGALGKSMVEVELVCGERRVRKKVPASLTVGRLKLLAEKLLRVKAARQALLLTPLAAGGGDGAAGREPEDITHDDARELRYYGGGGGGGWQVEVAARDPEAAAAAAARARGAAAAAQELRMERHEAGQQQLRDEEARLMGAAS